MLTEQERKAFGYARTHNEWDTTNGDSYMDGGHGKRCYDDRVALLAIIDRLTAQPTAVVDREALEQFLAYFSVDMFGEARQIGPERAKVLAAGLLASGLIRKMPGRKDMVNCAASSWGYGPAGVVDAIVALIAGKG